MSETDHKKLAEMINGLSRFFYEGMTRWSKQDLLGLCNADMHFLEDPGVQAYLRKYEEDGALSLTNRNDIYLIVKSDPL